MADSNARNFVFWESGTTDTKTTFFEGPCETCHLLTIGAQYLAD